MDKSMIAKILLILLVFLVIGFVLYFVLDDGVSADEKHFKEEYESLNGKKNDHNKTYVQVSLPKSNNVKYASYEDVMDFLDNGSYEASIYADSENAHYRDNPFGILIQKKTIGKSDILDIYMASGGGFAIKLRRLS